MSRSDPHIVYICNALDEITKFERNITSDSPAATNKVISLTRSMRKAGLNAIVLSLARGRQNKSGARHNVKTRRLIDNIIINCAFWHLPIITHFVTAVSLACVINRLTNKYSFISLLVYNRSYHYVPALLLARIKKAKIFLDLEDGYNNRNMNLVRFLYNGFTQRLFNWLCADGAMIANTVLAKQVNHLSPYVCYGVAENKISPALDWDQAKLKLMFSGTLLEEVGSKLIITAIDILRVQRPDMVNRLHFIITGKGPCSDLLKNYANSFPEWVSFYGDLSRADYFSHLIKCHIGLSLRLAIYEMGTTTFPSKVIEYAQHGLLVVSTKSTDVPIVFGNGALYLDDESPAALAKLIASFPDRKNELKNISSIGRDKILSTCSPDIVGQKFRTLFLREC